MSFMTLVRAAVLTFGVLQAQAPKVRIPAASQEVIPTVKQVAGDRWADRAAQAWAESGFQRYAKSAVGAEGYFQFMPSTWKGGQKQGWIPAGLPTDLYPSVVANHNYMLRIEGQTRNWMGPVPKEGGWYDASLGGYNAGPGNIKKGIFLAEQFGLPTTAWKQMLPKVTKEHSKETLGYIPRNYLYIEVLKGSK